MDDIIITNNDQQEIDHAKLVLKKHFDIKDLGKFHYLMGLEVSYSHEVIFLYQTKYTLDLLKEIGLTRTNITKTHMEMNMKLHQDVGDPAQYKRNYQCLIGKLIYLTATRPYITFFVNRLSQFMQDPNKQQVVAVYRLLKYLHGNPGKGILFRRNEGTSIKGNVDADWQEM